MKRIKDFLPKSLFGRALLILVLPTVLIQLVVTYVFFDRHWDDVTRRIAINSAGEVQFFIQQLKKTEANHRDEVVAEFVKSTGINVFFDGNDSFRKNAASREFPEFQRYLRAKIEEPFTLRLIDRGATIEIRVALQEEVLRLEMTSKRLASRTTIIFVLWMVAASVVFLLIAIVFLRNQIRPISQLAEAADNFGRGLDMPGFRPHGASEVRRAARAFIVMRERIKRQIRTRTEMLAGISHDLRTPLTRMKLQLAMLGDTEEAKELSDDVQQMEHMIEEYLDFARGEGGEEAVRTALHELLAEVAADYQRANAKVVFAAQEELFKDIRVSAFRRMLHNIIDNALRYGKKCDIGLRKTANFCEITIDDDGPGIPEEKRDEVFKPFIRLDPSRNAKTGGVGLGLTIARDVALAHGGGIVLENVPQSDLNKSGLRVIIRLPL
jgi:two-component system osmolarity sensor histidine kinase EnvZ